MQIFKFYKIYILLFLALSPICLNKGFSIEKSTATQIQEIDKKINILEEMKRGYEAKALKHANQAQVLQFIDGELQVAKRHWKLTDDNRQIAIRIQKEIDVLKVQKMQLLKKERRA
ncbi:MAG: hypothetical protein KR126chlam6_00441 [Candidatus Anoxychlamydiales bacterium]|nr:hypothetical protein [Candidatus Anoxychlamydiales bacterium]